MIKIPFFGGVDPMKRFRLPQFAKSFLALLALILIMAGMLAANPTRPARAQAGAQPLFVETGAVTASNLSQAAIRSRNAALDMSVLLGDEVSGQAVENSLIQFNLFDDTILDGVVERVETTALGSQSWIGHIAGQEISYFYLVYTQDVLAAHIAYPDGVYEVRYAGDAVYTINQLDQSLYPDDIVLEPALPFGAAGEGGVEAQGGGAVNIDVLVLYTQSAETAAGGEAAMQALVNLAITETNQSYVNSNIAQQITLVHAEKASGYTESSDFGVNLSRLQGKTDGYLDNVHALRDQYKADLVSLIINNTQYCGIAYLMTDISPAFESLGFSVVHYDCATGYYSFGHELGHNMGARHDRYVDNTDTPDHAYAHGYAYPAASWRTIMAYNNACTAVGKNCTRLQYWSNPATSHGGVPMGVAGTADNHTMLYDTGPTIANFRVSAPGAFSKYSPGDTATNLPTTSMTLSWGTSSGAVKYEYC
ncbi:MAG: hypothetical protein EHM81_00390, partial [Chloroflexi bacterium]